MMGDVGSSTDYCFPPKKIFDNTHVQNHFNFLENQTHPTYTKITRSIKLLFNYDA